MAKYLVAHGNENKLDPADAFAELNQEARAQLSVESAREHENYTHAVAQRRHAEKSSASRCQVFICTADGIVNRVALESVPERRKVGGRNRVLLKVPPGDRVCSACLLSSADDALDEWDGSSVVGSGRDLGTSLPETCLPNTPMPGTPL